MSVKKTIGRILVFTPLTFVLFFLLFYMPYDMVKQYGLVEVISAYSIVFVPILLFVVGLYIMEDDYY